MVVYEPLPPEVQAQQDDNGIAGDQPVERELDHQLGIHRSTFISLTWVMLIRAITDHSSD